MYLIFPVIRVLSDAVLDQGPGPTRSRADIRPGKRRTQRSELVLALQDDLRAAETYEAVAVRGEKGVPAQSRQEWRRYERGRKKVKVKRYTGQI